MEDKLKNLQEKFDNLTQALRADTEVRDNILKDIKKLDFDKKLIEKELVKVHSEIKQAQEQLNLVVDDLNDSITKKDQLISKIEILNKDVLATEKEALTKKTEIDNQLALMVEQIDATKGILTKEIQLAQLEKDALNNELVIINSKISSLMVKVNDITVEIEDKTKLNKTISKELEVKNVEFDSLCGHYDEMFKKSIAIKDEIIAGEQKLIELRDGITSLEKEKSILKVDVQTFKDEKLELENELAKKAFILSEKDQILTQKEEYIKEKYALAGLKY